MSSAYEQSIPWPWEGGSVGVFGDMECDVLRNIYERCIKTKMIWFRILVYHIYIRMNGKSN